MSIKKTLSIFLISLLLISCDGISDKSKVDYSSNMSKKKDTLILAERESKQMINLANKYKNLEGRKFPKVVNLNNFHNTDFVITLENKLSSSKNVIYSSSLLLAWDKLKKLLKAPITVDSTFNNELKLLNQSSSYYGSLKSEEYKTETKVQNGNVYIKAFFNKSLPFATRFHTFDNGVVFGNVRVRAFGIKYFELELNRQIKILYYKDDNHFVIKLFSIYADHEIFLVKGLQSKGCFLDMIDETNKLTNIGKNERKIMLNNWKYVINTNDILTIPVINFNIETNCEKLENQQFNSDNVNYIFGLAYQRTAFIIDEYGAKVESEAMFPAAKKREIKKLVFDKPFIIYLKRKECNYPYFAMKIMDTELMIKK